MLVGASSNAPEVAAWANIRFGSVGPGMELNHRSQTTNSRARAFRTGNWSGPKLFITSPAVSRPTSLT